MPSVVSSVRHRVDPAPVTALLVLGDLACIGVFVLAGASQGHDIDPVTQSARIANTFATFAIGWTLAAVVVGLYTAEVRRSTRQTVMRTIPAWIAAAVVAQGLRATSFFPGDAALAFFFVSVGVGLLLLVPWRVVVTRLARRV